MGLKQSSDVANRTLLQARREGFKLEAGQKSLEKTIQELWSTSGMSMVDYLALKDLQNDPAKVFLSNIDSTSKKGRDLLDELKAMGIKGAKNPDLPVGESWVYRCPFTLLLLY